MNIKNLIPAILIGVATWLIIGLIIALVGHTSYGAALVRPYNFFLGALAGVGSYTGFSRRNR